LHCGPPGEALGEPGSFFLFCFATRADSSSPFSDEGTTYSAAGAETEMGTFNLKNMKTGSVAMRPPLRVLLDEAPFFWNSII